jgi:hypothetical protein
MSQDTHQALGIALPGILILIALILALVTMGHGMTSKHQDSIGVVMQQENPMTYIAGSVTNMAYAGRPENYGIVIRVQPIGAYTLYTEDITFCPDGVKEKFEGKHNPMVLTYERQAHHTIEGIGCHDLQSVHEIVTEKIQ